MTEVVKLNPGGVGLSKRFEFRMPVLKTLELASMARLTLPVRHGGQIVILSVMFLVAVGTRELALLIGRTSEQSTRAMRVVVGIGHLLGSNLT